MTEPQQKPVRDVSGRNAFRNTAFIVLLLGLLSPFRSLVALVFVATGFIWLLRQTLSFNLKLGIAAILLTASTACAYAILLYMAEQRHQSLLARLEAYPGVTVRRAVLPLPHVCQISVDRSVSNDQLFEILKLEELDGLTDVYLESDKLTDACLSHVADISKLRYVFIDSDGISDDAILAFEQRVPDCIVIPYKRNLHGRY